MQFNKNRNLIVCDEDNSTSDPYVKVSLPEIKMTKKTKVVKKSLNPTFDELLVSYVFNIKVKLYTSMKIARLSQNLVVLHQYNFFFITYVDDQIESLTTISF